MGELEQNIESGVDQIESGLNQMLGRSGEEAIDLPHWATPVLVGVAGALLGRIVGGAVAGRAGGNLAAVVGGILGTAAASGSLDELIGSTQAGTGAAPDSSSSGAPR
jgi:hypothetical protein